jgi:acetylornithine deacetylase/succinyl-diaminopimelate desuccinylase-like protein
MTPLLAVLVALQGAATDSLSPAARRIQADVHWLADDAREGRGINTAGLTASGEYIANALRRAGIQPAAPGTYFQDFTLAADAPGVMHTNLGGATARNVVGVIPGSGKHKGQVIVIGAHYDHLGMGGANALDPDSTGKPHNGADDNASGTATVLEVARILKGRRPLDRTVVVVLFSAEEEGDLGSAYYVKHPLVQPVDSIYAMLNLDMVGRIKENRLIALGAATATEFLPLLDSLNGGPGTNGGARFVLKASGDGWGPSDHASFYAAKRPVLHFFTDLHEDYHRSTDDWDKIDVNGAARIAAFVADVATALGNRPGALTFVDAPQPQLTGGSPGAAASLGTIPDMTESPGGVKIAGVRAGGPAALAGMQAGDVITRIGEYLIANLYDMTNALRAHKPGDTVVVVFKRGETEQQVTAVLVRRGS